MSKPFLLLALLSLGLATVAVPSQPAHAQTALSQKPVLTTLHRFDGAHGRSPQATMTLGRDGNFYGTTRYGGADRAGTIFKMTPQCQFTTLFAFDRRNGHLPVGRLVEGTDGNFYGVTSQGFNDNDAGTVFRITPQGVLKTLHVFSPLNNNHKNSDGAGPQGGLILASDSDFYGTTRLGGLGKGVVFRITSQGQFTVLHNFRGSEGYNPEAPLVQASDGNFYGTASSGGPSFDPNNYIYGRGTIFRMKPNGAVTLLHTFDYPHGAEPVTGLTIGSDEALYGTTVIGGLKDAGDSYGSFGYGTLFRITTKGQFTTVHRFSEDGHGIYPYASLTLGPDGNLYGAVTYNFYDEQHYTQTGAGSIFRVTPQGDLTTIYKFHTVYDGRNPVAGVIFSPNGVIYGTTYGGGLATPDGYGYGTIYKLTLPQ